jgi:hypothetical protein
MPPMKSLGGLLGLAILSIHGLGVETRGQAVAFDPIVGAAPTGQTMTATAVVSADRRYVRLGVNPYFNAVNGFTNFTTSLGAASGVPAGGGAGGGGGNLNAGMNGVIGPAGSDGGSGYSVAVFVGPFGELRAGPLPFEGGFVDGTSMPFVGDSGAAMGWNGWWANDFTLDRAQPLASSSRADASAGRGGIATTKTLANQRRVARKSSSLSQKARRPRAARVAESNDVEPIIKPKKKTE